MDFEKKLWTIPANRMKAAKEHRVPLSQRSMEIIISMRKKGTEGSVFPGPRPKQPLSTMAMAMLLRRMKPGITVNGFRSSFRDWASEATGFSHEVCEMAPGTYHRQQGRGRLRRGDLFEKRCKLMEALRWVLRYAKSGEGGPTT